MPHFLPQHYVAIAIAAEYLNTAAVGIGQRFPSMQVTAVVMDFFAALDWPDTPEKRALSFFYPASSIGNFSPVAALNFLQRLSKICRHSVERSGDLLIGVDLVKSPAALKAAYDDALGVTACFNLNLLLHLNELLGADFDVREFRHRAVFNTDTSRIEMSLVARTAQQVHWRGGERHFKQGEALVTEHSYKYRQQNFVVLLRDAGFTAVQCWHDADEAFMACHALCGVAGPLSNGTIGESGAAFF